MAENVYEGMFLLDSNRYGRDPEGVSSQVSQLIREAGGEILISRLWEERRLAYSIKGRRKGTYWLTYFRIDGEKLTDLNRQCRLRDNILRVLFVKIDPRIVDTLVEHARAGQVKKVGERAEREIGKPPGKPPEKPAEELAAAAGATVADEPVSEGEAE
ncbi:MAG: 30S ribosomal protein S6 [Planctomycetota bacterium]